MALYSLAVGPVTELLGADGLGLLVALYVGPDQILPLTSVLGAIVGVVLLGWRYLVGLAGRVRQFFSRR
jgi:hypothetical protein